MSAPTHESPVVDGSSLPVSSSPREQDNGEGPELPKKSSSDDSNNNDSDEDESEESSSDNDSDHDAESEKYDCFAACGAPSTSLNFSQISAQASSKSRSTASRDRARHTRASFRRRTSLVNNFRSHLRVLLLVPVGLACCGFVVATYVCIRNIFVCDPQALAEQGFYGVPKSSYDSIRPTQLQKSIPNIYWSFGIDYFLIFGLLGSNNVLALVHCLFSPDVTPSMSKHIALSFGTAVCMFVLGLLGFCVAVRFRVYARGLVLVGMVVVLSYITRCAGNKAALLKPHTAERNRRLAWLVVKFGVVFFGGYYLKIMFAQTLFPTVKELLRGSMSNPDGTLCTAIYCQIIQSLVETIMATSFFSVYFPMWSRFICNITLEITDLYNDDESINVDVLERAQLCVNFLTDLLRFIYGRGVLFKLSAFYIFLIMVLKDNAFNIWHFAFKYTPHYIIFMLKVFFPGGGKGVVGPWKVAAKFIENFVRLMGTPKKLAVNWVDEVDYRETDPSKCVCDSQGRVTTYKEPETPIKISLRFSNVQVNINNVPVGLGHAMMQRMSAIEESDPLSRMYDTMSTSLGSFGLSRKLFAKSMSEGGEETPAAGPPIKKKQIRRGSVALTGFSLPDLAQSAPVCDRPSTLPARSVIYSGANIDPKTRDSRILAGMTSTPLDNELLGKTDASSYPSFPHLPVNTGEIEVLRSLCECIQFKIFQRYQTRVMAKLYTSFLFMFVPTIASLTSAKFLPGYESPFTSDQYLRCGLIFVITDIVEWTCITFGVFARTPGFHEKVDHYRVLLMKNLWIRIVVSALAILFGILWFQIGWDPWEERRFNLLFPDTNFEVIVNICKPFLKNVTLIAEGLKEPPIEL